MPSSPIRSATEATFDAEIAPDRGPAPVLVDFTATWCPPCRMLSPILHALAADMGGRLTVVEVNGDDHPKLAARFGVRAFPTMVLFAGGKEVARHVGLTTRDRIRRLVDPHLPAAPEVHAGV